MSDPSAIASTCAVQIAPRVPRPPRPVLAVAFDARARAFAADGVVLRGAHAAIARLVVGARRPAASRTAPGRLGGLAGGRLVHAQLEHYYTFGAPAPDEHPLAAALRGALAPLRMTGVAPEMPLAAPDLGVATAADAVGWRGGHFFVIEFKTGFAGVFDTAAAGRWRRAVAPALAAADVACTPRGLAVVQGMIGALALARTRGVALADISVVVVRAWTVGVRDLATGVVCHLADPVFARACAAIEKALRVRPRRPGAGRAQ